MSCAVLLRVGVEMKIKDVNSCPFISDAILQASKWIRGVSDNYKAL